MSETTGCRWDADQDQYLRPDGDPCKRDDYGDPTRHCTMRRCSNHVGPRELTCARCLGRTRSKLRRIPVVASLLPLVAIEGGVNSEAANLSGPAADYATFSARRRIAKRWIDENIHQEARDWCKDPDCQERHFKARGGDRWHKRGIENAYADLLADDDEQHPYMVLGRWDMMIREDYDHPSDEPVTVTNAAAYLDRQLGRIAQDDDQDFGLFASEIRKCLDHLERVLHTAMLKQRGVPCPDCTSEETGVGPRLVREFGHWCEAEDCERLHYLDESADVWRCPRDRDHWWTAEGYGNLMDERKGA